MSAHRVYPDDGARHALRRRRRRRRIRQGLAWAVLGVVGVAGGLALSLGWREGLTWLRTNTDLFTVRQVDVSDTRFVEPWEIVDRSNIDPGDDLIDVSEEKVQEILEADPRLKSGRVERGFVDRRVRLEVVERRPLAVVACGEGLWEVDAEGMVLGSPPGWRQPTWIEDPDPVLSRRGVELPLITGLGTLASAGEPVTDAGALEALGFLYRLEQYGFPGSRWISEIRVDAPGELTAYTLEGGVPVRVGDGRLSARTVRALFLSLEEITTRKVAVRYVDLRYHDMVVVKEG